MRNPTARRGFTHRISKQSPRILRNPATSRRLGNRGNTGCPTGAEMETSTPTASPDERHESFSRVQWQADDCSAAMYRNRSPLLRLPGELRNKIYQYTLSDCTLGYRKCSPVNVATANMDDTAHIYHLSLTCRQVYEETRELAYRLATFRIDCPELYSHLIFGRDKNDFTKIEISPLHMFMPVLHLSKIHYSHPSRSVRLELISAWKNMFKDFVSVPHMTILFAARETDCEYAHAVDPDETAKGWCHELVPELLDYEEHNMDIRYVEDVCVGACTCKWCAPPIRVICTAHA